MSLDDLRAKAHVLAKDSHEFDLDLHAAMTSLTQRAETLSTRANELATALQNYQPAPGGPTNPSPVRFGRYIYNDPDISAKWDYQVVQGQAGTIPRVPQLKAAGVRDVLRYTFPCTWTDHPDVGVRAAVDPAVFRREWLATRNGATIKSTKFSSGPNSPNLLIDVGIEAYQQASAEWLIRKCRTEGYTGIYLDEINEFQSYAGYKVPSRYGTDYQFQQAQLSYIQYVAAALKTAGFSCHVNLASNPNAWRQNVASAVDGVEQEFFIVQWTVNDPNTWHIASIENGVWKEQLDWLAWSEARGKTMACQADARSEAQVLYALASFLLVTEGKGVFAATKGGYGLGAAWWVPAMDVAKKLGKPLGAATKSPTSELRTRDFERGTVVVNPTQRAIGSVPTTTGTITLR